MQTLKDYLAILPLQIGYLIIFLMFIIPFFILNYSLKDFEKNFIFKLNLAFATIYIFHGLENDRHGIKLMIAIFVTILFTILYLFIESIVFFIKDDYKSFKLNVIFFIIIALALLYCYCCVLWQKHLEKLWNLIQLFVSEFND